MDLVDYIEYILTKSLFRSMLIFLEYFMSFINEWFCNWERYYNLEFNQCNPTCVTMSWKAFLFIWTGSFVQGNDSSFQEIKSSI